MTAAPLLVLVFALAHPLSGRPLRVFHPLCLLPFLATWGLWTVLDLGRVYATSPDDPCFHLAPLSPRLRRGADQGGRSRISGLGFSLFTRRY